MTSKEHLIVKNLGPISDLDINLKRYNVFIGAQGVGKSVLAKLLSLLRDVSLGATLFNENAQKKKEALKVLFGVFGLRSFLKDDSYILYRGELGIDMVYEKGDFNFSGTKEQLQRAVVRLSEMMEKDVRMIKYILGLPGEMGLPELLEKYPEEAFNNMRSTLYCPAERNLASLISANLASFLAAQIPVPALLVSFMSFFEKARKENGEYDTPFPHITYRYKNNEDTICYGESEVPLSEAASGLQSSVPLMMVVDYCVGHQVFDSFTIEEPEMNLYPSNIERLLGFLVSKSHPCGGETLNMTITTHSPYTLSVLNMFLLGGKIRRERPEAEAEVGGVLSGNVLIDPEEFAAFALQIEEAVEPYCVSIVDGESGLIDENFLDEISEEMEQKISELMSIIDNRQKAGAGADGREA